ncbi:MAG: ABC transporter substrate-binding protein [Candidatus Bathyarchaeia archaeon]
MSEKEKVSRRGWIKYAGAGVVVVAAAAGAGYYATQPKPTPTPTLTPTTPTPTPTTTPTPKGPPIRIGVMMGLTGAYSGNCKKMLDGAKLAIKHVNEAGGVLGRPLEPYIRDDELNPGIAVRRATELVETAKIEVLFGTLGTHVVHALNDYMKKVGKIYFACCIPVVATKKKDVRSPYTYFMLPSSAAISRSGGLYCAGLCKNWYLIYPDYSGGVEFSTYFKEGLEKKGAKVVGIDAAPLGCTDFSPFITRAMAAKPEGLAWCGQLGTDLQNALKQCRGFKVTEKMYMFSGNNTLTDSMAAGIDAISGVYTFLDFYWALDREPTRKYSEAYVAEYGEYPDTYSIGTYTAIRVWADAVNKAGTTDSEAVKKILDSMKFDYCKGPQYFRWDGQCMQDLFYVRGRKPEEVLKGRKPEEVPPNEKYNIFEFVHQITSEEAEPTKEEEGYA